MYKNLITRRIGSLVEQYGRKVSLFDDSKKKEMVVLVWLQRGKDKDQVKKYVMDNFNVSDQDAEDLYFEAYPEGTDSLEDKILDDLDETLKRVVNMKASAVVDAIDVVAGFAPEILLDQHNLHPTVKNQLKMVISTLLKRRNLA